MVEHVDPEALALAALGEPLTDADRAHVATCETCRQEISSLARAVATARTVTPADALVAPPAEVWAAIRSELDLTPALEPDGRDTGRDPVAPVASSSGGAAASDVSEIRAPRRRRAPWIAAAAAVGVVIGAAGGAWWVERSTNPPQTVVAETALDPLPGWTATGQAVVEKTPDGRRVLVLSLSGDTDGDGFREVWLIDRDVTRLVSLGVLDGSEGRFTVPDGLDLSDFAVVDVSEEGFDGDPAHSGDSIVRGVLGT
jgi:hypothetical protein